MIDVTTSTRILGLSIFIGCLSASPFPLQADEKMAPYGFAPAEIFLSDFNTREMRTADINQDGRLDVLILNPDKARLDFYFQNDPETGKAATPQMHQDRWEPMLSHPRFSKESLIPGAQLMALEVGDFNEDGHIDFATINTQDKLDIYHGPMEKHQKPSYSLSVHGHHGYKNSLKWHKEDQALYYLGPQLLESFHWDNKAKAYHTERVAQLPHDQDPHQLQFVDLNHDGKSDIIYELTDTDYGLAYHLREKDHWSPLQRPLVKPASASFVPSSTNGILHAIHTNSGAIQSFELTPVAIKVAKRPVSVEEIHLPSFRQGQFITLDGKEGLRSILLFSPGQSEIHQVKVDENGQLGFPQAHILPSGCQWMLKGNFLPKESKRKTEDPQILIHNPKNLYLGLIHFEDEELQFPLPLPNQSALICAQTWRPKGADRDQILAIVRKDKRELALKRWRIIKNGDEYELEEIQHLDLEEVKRDPEAFFLLPPEAGRPNGFLVTSPLGDSFYLFEAEDGSGDLSVVNPPKGFSSEQLKKKRAGNFRRYDPTLKLPSALAYVEGKELQFYSVNAQGVLRLVKQINSENISSLLDLLPLDQRGERIALVSSGGRDIEIHQLDESGDYEFDETFTFAPGSFHSSQLVQVSKKEWELRLLGNHQFRRIFAKADRWQLESQTVYQSALPDFWPGEILRGDMNGDGQIDLLLLEQVRHHMFEILSGEKNRWTSELHFPIFEKAPGSPSQRGGNSEPREVLIVDVNGDNLDDILMLIHDRMLLYLQDTH